MHLLKYVVDPASYDRLAADPQVSDPLTASDAKVAEYADHYFEYDASRRATKSTVEGGARTYTYAYAESAFADDYNNWKTKTTVTQPDGAQEIIFANYAGQTMLRVLKSGADEWLEYTQYDSSARPILQANPSALSGYDETKADLLNNNQYFKDNDGFLRLTEYDAVSGNVSAEKIKKGQLGTEIKLREYEYVACELPTSSSSSSSSSSSGPPDAAYFLSKEIVYPSDTDQTKQITTSYSYTFHPGTCQVQHKTTILPAVPTSQNGSGVSATRKECFDLHGNLIWQMDERGYITRHIYDIPTGAQTQLIQDVDTTQVTDEPSGWTTPSDGGKHVVTDYEHDDRGRVTQVLGPAFEANVAGAATDVRTATWTVFKEADFEVRTAQGYATGAQWDTFTLVNPVSITKVDKAGKVLEEIRATRSSTSGKLTASDSFAQSSYVRWTTHQFSDCCLEDSTRVYHTIPSSGEGSSGVNYDQTTIGYGANNRRNKTVSPGGTITRTVFDARGHAAKIYVGTDDTDATDSDPTGGGATGNDMVLLVEQQYDSGADGGDNNLTKETQHVDATTTRITHFDYDWRNRQVDIDGEEDFFQRSYFDNLDRVTRMERYDTLALNTSSSSSSSESSSTTGNLVTRSDTKFDDLSRIYQTIRYAVNPATGAVGNTLTDNTWYDATGNTIKQKPAGSEKFTKTSYDSLRRNEKEFVGFDVDETAYADTDDVLGDTIFEQTETTYDDAGNVTQTTLRKRLHDATGTGELTTPSGTQPKARVYYVATYSDATGRQTAIANYGTNDDSSFTRFATIPSRGDTILVTTTGYNDDGEAFQTIDPAGKEDRTEFDDVGRVVKTIQNYIESSSSSSSSCCGPHDENATVLTSYNADGQIASITAVNCVTGDQVTRYVYETTLSDSGIARSDLLRAEIYPDSDDVADPLGDGPDNIYDRIEYKYNRQGQRTEMKDQNGSVRAYDYDGLGRQTQDRVTTLGSGVDGAVRRIATTYEVRGLREKTTSYDHAAVGSGVVVNEVLAEYNDLGMLVKEYQEHDGVKDASTPYVGYNYDETAAGGEFTKGLRLKSLRYPDGRLVHHTYGSNGSDADNLSRLDAIKDDSAGSPGTTLASFAYLGFEQVVIEEYEEPDVKLDLFGGTSGSYVGLDRFDRVIDQKWHDYGASADRDRFKYGYDRASNRIYRENTLTNGKDEFYTYDRLHRIKDFDRGDLNVGNTAISGTPVREEGFTLDLLGNWTGYIIKTSGTTDLDQSRSANQVNEIADIAANTGATWSTPDYDRGGNMTTTPRPADQTLLYTCTYDAWNRLVKITAGPEIVTTHEYDGQNHRILEHVYAGGMLDHTRHAYYTDQWQVLEERVDSSVAPDQQLLWGPTYVDHLILRRRDTSNPPNGDLNETVYALQDALWNVTALVDTTGSVIERYEYSVYGSSTVLSNDFGSRSSSAYDWTWRFSGLRRDPNSRLIAQRMRYYHPSVGVFMSRDPEGYIDSPSLYEYARSNPVNYVDPTGLWSCCCRVLGANVRFLRTINDLARWPFGAAKRWGNEFLVDIALHYPLSPGKDCTLEWWEWSTRGYTSPFGNPLEPGIWTDMFPGHIRRNPTLAGWKKRKQPCPGSEPVFLVDQPTLVQITPPRIKWRLLFIAIRVQGGCNIAPGLQTLYIRQDLLVVNGRGRPPAYIRLATRGELPPGLPW